MDGIHTAIIMDGNGRWPPRALPRQEAPCRRSRLARRHRGRAALRHLDAHLVRLQLRQLETPRVEVDALMALMRQALVNEARRCVRHGIRSSAIGRATACRRPDDRVGAGRA